MFSKIIQLWQKEQKPTSISFGRAVAHVTWCAENGKNLRDADLNDPNIPVNLPEFNIERDLPRFPSSAIYLEHLINNYCPHRIYPDNIARQNVEALKGLKVRQPSKLETFKNICYGLTHFSSEHATPYRTGGFSQIKAVVDFSLNKPTQKTISPTKTHEYTT